MATKRAPRPTASPTITARPIWICPSCGARFVNKNNWHSCGQATLADWKARMGPQASRLYERFVQLIADCGRFHVAPAKTRIAFLGRVRFAGITSLSETAMTCSFSLPYPLDTPRFAKVEEVVPGWWVHRMRITDPAQLDEQVQAGSARATASWACRSGCRRRQWMVARLQVLVLAFDWL